MNLTMRIRSECLAHVSSARRNLSHRNLVQLYGVCTQQKPIYLVTEFMELGCLLNYLRQRRGALGSQDLLGICHDVSQGMQHLEQNGFIHRDLVRKHTQIQQSCDQSFSKQRVSVSQFRKFSVMYGIL